MKGVTAIPLEEDRARTVLSSLASRNKVDRRVSLLPTEASQAELQTEDAEASVAINGEADSTRSPRVKFADEHEVKVVSPRPDQEFNLNEDTGPPSPSSSTASTPSSTTSNSTDTVVKALTERLSFWTRLSKRNSRQNSTIDHILVEQPEPAQAPIDPADLESILKDPSKDPEEVIDSIVASAAPPPQTIEEKHSELEAKIVRECIREFTRGGMYFAYSYGGSSGRSMLESPCINASCRHHADTATQTRAHNEGKDPECAVGDAQCAGRYQTVESGQRHGGRPRRAVCSITIVASG